MELLHEQDSLQVIPAEEHRVIVLPDHPDQTHRRWPPITFYQRIGKRIFDLSTVLLFAPIWLPIYLITAAVLLVVQRRPIHFVSTRPGKNCREFNIVKFRTMRTGAEDDLLRLLEDNQDLATEYRHSAKLKDDPRVTSIGRVLRRLSLDEIPQIWNVIRGDMSLVGPRPPTSADELDSHFGSLSTYAFRVRPGLTGLWQSSREADICYERRVWLDLVYSSRCSFLMDLKTLVQTLPGLVQGHGSF